MQIGHEAQRTEWAVCDGQGGGFVILFLDVSASVSAHCSLLTAHCSLLTAHCSLLTASHKCRRQTIALLSGRDRCDRALRLLSIVGRPLRRPIRPSPKHLCATNLRNRATDRKHTQSVHERLRNRCRLAHRFAPAFLLLCPPPHAKQGEKFESPSHNADFRFSIFDY